MKRDLTPIWIVLLGIGIIGAFVYIQWYRYRWMHDADALAAEGRGGRAVCEVYCEAAGGIVTEVRVMFTEGGAHLMPECICLVEEGVDPE